MHPITDRLSYSYSDTWDTFVAQLTELRREIEEAITHGDIPSLHGLLGELHPTPYDKAHLLLASSMIDRHSTNPGSITGLFFEIMVATIAAARIKRTLPDAVIWCNKTNDSQTSAIARDPDIFVEYGDKRCVIEVKVAPKKRDLEYMLRLKDRYDQDGIGFFLVGGYVSREREALKEWGARKWACFLVASPAQSDVLIGAPTVDDVLDEAVLHLAAAETQIR